MNKRNLNLILAMLLFASCAGNKYFEVTEETVTLQKMDTACRYMAPDKVILYWVTERGQLECLQFQELGKPHELGEVRTVLMRR